MTRELMMLAPDVADQGQASLGVAWTAIEVDLPSVDLDHLAAAAAAAAADELAAENAASIEQELRPEIQTSTEHDQPALPDVLPDKDDLAEEAEESTDRLEDAQRAVESGEGRRQLEPFAPAWEVDGFRWPPLCGDLDERTGGKLQQSGQELFMATGDGLKVLAVASVSRREGRSTLALALAQQAARAGCRVALLDADAGNPDLARQLGLESPCDWLDVVLQGQPLSEAAVSSLADHMTLFPLSCTNETPASAQGQLLAEALPQLSCHFDLVIIDLPPASMLPFGPAAATRPGDIDMAVVVRNLQTTSEKQTLETVSKLRSCGVRAVGIIENFAPSTAVNGDG